MNTISIIRQSEPIRVVRRAMLMQKLRTGHCPALDMIDEVPLLSVSAAPLPANQAILHRAVRLLNHNIPKHRSNSQSNFIPPWIVGASPSRGGGGLPKG